MNGESLSLSGIPSASESELEWLSNEEVGEEEEEEDGAEVGVEAEENLSDRSSRRSSIRNLPTLLKTKLSMSQTSEGVAGHGSSKLMMLSAIKGKETVPMAMTANPKPLQLLDLPVDVLREIVRRVNHTNDLASLALTHSALHDLVIPQMYSRFDIIWPDDRSTDDSGSGVDALTFGLATLVMGEEIFNRGWPDARSGRGLSELSLYRDCGATRPSQSQSQEPHNGRDPGSTGGRWRKGNHYARYVRKFSIGNGPEHMVSDYLFTKESGKMLGTLAALAIAQMPMLETFVWDMRTGVLRDVWLALSSLGDRSIDGACRLKRVWFRCHDNSLVPAERRPIAIMSSSGHTHASAFAGILASTGPTPVPPPPPAILFRPGARPRAFVDRPSFSILPPLESLTVLEVDELAYLDEMSVLIERSQPRLRELRVGIAFEARERDWVTVLTGDDLVQVDHSVTWQSSTMAGSRRLAGPLGVLIGRIYDINDKRRSLGLAGANTPTDAHVKSHSVPDGVLASSPGPTNLAPATPEASGFTGPHPAAPAATGASATLSQQGTQVTPPSAAVESIKVGLAPHKQKAELTTVDDDGSLPVQGVHDGPAKVQGGNADTGPLRIGRLKLDLLELERVPLCIPVMIGAFDWRSITSLTILNCPLHERLWGSVRRACRPVYSASARTSSSLRRHSESAQSRHTLSYPLRLKKLWTDTVSSALMAFLRDTLAPDSLEVLFLQEAYDYKSDVTIDSICQGPIKRHRRSLKKVLIDSVKRSRTGHVIGGRKWRRWMLSDENVAFVINSKMSSLRELSIALDGSYWHVFLQRLPSIPHLRSLHVTNITSPFRTRFGLSESREMALQVIDIVALRPELELCYLAIGQKCFEIVEGKYDKRPWARTDIGAETNPPSSDTTPTISSDEDDDLQDDDDDEAANGAIPVDVNEVESDESSSPQPAPEELVDSWASEGDSPVTLRLREILFYDDKVAIFKARNGHL